jgi:FkbM family methyltransferase
MMLHGEWWCPDILKGPAAFLRRAQDLNRYLPRIPQKRACVQAGGHIGVYPKILSACFERVYTFEPEHENFGCLVRNVPAENVYAARAALSDRHGGVEFIHHGKSSGGHQIGNGSGPLPRLCVDDLALEDCDALFLDVEGYEIRVLRGALATIAKCHPLIVAEENKKVHGRGFEYGDIEKLLTPLGYQIVDRVGEDVVLRWKS